MPKRQLTTFLRITINAPTSKTKKSVITRINKINEEVSALTDSFVKAKSVLLQNSIEKKMAEYEVLLNDLETQKAQLELERGYRITREDLLAFIEEILKGDVNDKNYQKQIIDHLVSQVFVSDDDTIVYFNIRGGKDIEKMTFDDVKNTKNNMKSVQTQSPLASNKELRLNARGLYFCYTGFAVGGSDKMLCAAKKILWRNVIPHSNDVLK